MIKADLSTWPLFSYNVDDEEVIRDLVKKKVQVTIKYISIFDYQNSNRFSRKEHRVLLIYVGDYKLNNTNLPQDFSTA